MPQKANDGFKRIRLADLRQGRHGKHHELMMRIIEELSALPDGEAVIIPTKKFNVPLANLRSALMKGTAARDLEIATYSEDSTLYVWRKTAASSKYERAAKQVSRPKRS